MASIVDRIWLKVFYSDRLRNIYKWTLLHRPLSFIPYPTTLEIEPTTMTCPIQCRICENPHFPKEVRHQMTFDEFKLIVDQFPVLKWIGLTGIGEAWTNPDFPKMLKYVKEEKKPFIEIYDNFYFLDEEKIKFLIKYVDRIWISIDGCTKGTYEKVRLNSDFEKVVKNLTTFFNMKKEMKSKKPKIDFHFIINSLNLKEVPDFVDWVSSFNLHPKEFLILFTKILHPFEEVKDIYMEEVPLEIIKEAEKRAAKYNIWIQWAGDISTTEAKHAWKKENPEIGQCCAWLQPFFFSTGEVMPCCAQNEFGKREWQIERSMGNIFETKDFKKIWNGERYTELKKMIRKNQTPPYCEDCPIYKTSVKEKNDKK
jgi:sulfatase maturation enzyme AslB (radical SAM superfamily)